VSHGSLEVGQAGVETALDILDSELRMVMRQAGTPSLGRITSSYVRDRRMPAW
jgi:isopentenyl diphosphate isomerase/L-lactate dehydrogenase-like FMN-dependent dehydrogenase